MVKHRKILIVDKDLAFVAAVKRVFAGRYSVTCACNGEDAWKKLRLQRPDLIILDALKDNTGEGLLFSRRLRRDKDFKSTPVMILTGTKHQPAPAIHDDTPGGPQFLPADLFMEKPQTPSRLLVPVEAALRANAPLRRTTDRMRPARRRLPDVILCIDPDGQKTAEYNRIFTEDGYEVETAPTLKDAISRMKQVKFRCIVMDVHLPDMAGYDAVSVIKTIDADVNIVVTVAENRKELEARVRKEDIFYYYIKSFDIEELKLAVRSAIAAAHSRDLVS